ncbi:MAG: cell division protein FtsH, partial [Clostridia bacterium]|nr:cell division protein FtsH [Clostridia bacterium]
MQEVKRPKKPLIYFYVAMILAILVFNCLVAPYLARKAIEDVDYGTFMTMTENGEIGKVQIQQNQIVFTDKEESAIYRTGVIEDPGLVERLHA